MCGVLCQVTVPPPEPLQQLPLKHDKLDLRRHKRHLHPANICFPLCQVVIVMNNPRLVSTKAARHIDVQGACETRAYVVYLIFCKHWTHAYEINGQHWMQ